MSEIISGMASGADTFAVEWAARFGFPLRAFPAEWDKHGRSAGPIRNQRMLDEGKPDLVVAFPGGKGTARHGCSGEESWRSRHSPGSSASLMIDMRL